MPHIKRIPIAELKVGMYIAELSNEWIPDNNLSRHGFIKKQSAIEHIAKLGIAEVYIDTDKGEDCAAGISQQELERNIEEHLQAIERSANASQQDLNTLDEMEAAEKIHQDTLRLITQVAEDVKMGEAIKLQPVEDMANNIATSIRRSQSALSCFTQIRNKDEYLIEHSFSVAVLMGMMARNMNLSADDTHELITGALLHDIGKTKVPDDILHKPSSLTPIEWEEMKRHVTYGEEILAQGGDLAAQITNLCAQHHERLDGTGYPRGLTKKNISLAGRLGAIVDVYDAITADRVYHNSMLPATAMKKLLEWSDNHLDRELVYQFIACMSIYPAGSLVALSDNTIAMVTEPNRRQQSKPVVQPIFDVKSQKKLPPKLVNLALSDSELSIVKPVDPADYPLDIKQLLLH